MRIVLLSCMAVFALSACNLTTGQKMHEVTAYNTAPTTYPEYTSPNSDRGQAR